MKTLALLSCFCLLLGCTRQEKHSPLYDEISSLLELQTQASMNELAKTHMDYPQDPFARDSYSVSKYIYELSYRHLQQLNNIDSCDLAVSIEYQCALILSDFYSKMLDTLSYYGKEKLPPASRPAKTIEENCLKMQLFTLKAMQMLVSQNMDCWRGLIEPELIILPESTRIKRGQFFSCLLTFTPGWNDGFKEMPVKIAKITLNGEPISLTGIKSKFSNRYIEYTPAQAGEYIMLFTKTTIRPSGKKETFISEVSFTVLP